MYFVSIYENRRMKPVEIVLRTGRGMRENDGGVNLRYIVSTYVNITVYPPVQLVYANNFFKKIVLGRGRIIISFSSCF
jgi:hypothetical protein